MRLTHLFISIIHVFLVGSKNKMIWIYTCRVITPVHDYHSFGNFSNIDFITNSMCFIEIGRAHV